jgi:hypothetical protein
MKRTQGGADRETISDSALRASDEDTSEIEIDDGAGPASSPSQEIRGRTTTTMYKDLCHASIDTNTSITDLINEGLRYVLYGAQPRHVGVRKKVALST